MCGHCFTKEYPAFPTWQAFAQFDLTLTQKLQLTDGLRYSGQKQLAKFQVCTSYTCAICGTEWWLSEPDNAWRGFFLPESQAKTQLAKFGRLDKVRGCVGLAVFVALLLGLVYYLSTR